MSSLLAFLSSKFTTQTENLATEALTYILRNSKTSSRTLEKFLNGIDNRLSCELFFQN